MDAVLPVAADSTTVLTAVLLLTFQSPASDLPNRLHVHLCVLVWITQREGIPAACPSSMASSAEPTEADVAAVTLSELFLDDDTQTQLMELARQQLRAEGKDEMAAEHALHELLSDEDSLGNIPLPAAGSYPPSSNRQQDRPYGRVSGLSSYRRFLHPSGTVSYSQRHEYMAP